MPDDNDASRAPDPESTSDSSQEELGRGARWVSSLAGGVLLVFGGYAVIATENEVGTAAVLLTGAVFSLMGIQGTPLRRFGSGEHGADFASVVKQRLGRAAGKAQQDGRPPEVAAAIADLAEEIISPRMRSVERGPAAYYDQVKAAIWRVGATDITDLNDGHRHGFDLVATLPSGKANVDVALTSRLSLGLYDVMRANQAIELLGNRFPGGFLMITNVPPSPQLVGYNAASSSDPKLFEIVTWNGPDDDSALARALVRKAR
jgi:hypothetical protein